MADDAVARIEALVRLGGRLAHRPAARSAPGPSPNLERQSILGSAWRKAIVQLLDRQAWPDIPPTLALARGRPTPAGAGDPRQPRLGPYGLINRLQLDALLGNEAAVDAGLIAKPARTPPRSRFDRTWGLLRCGQAGRRQPRPVAGRHRARTRPGAALKSPYQDAVNSFTLRPRVRFGGHPAQPAGGFLRCRAADPSLRRARRPVVELGGAPPQVRPARQAPQPKGARKPAGRIVHAPALVHFGPSTLQTGRGRPHPGADPFVRPRTSAILHGTPFVCSTQPRDEHGRNQIHLLLLRRRLR